MNEEIKVLDENEIEEGVDAVIDNIKEAGGGFEAIVVAGAVIVVGTVAGVLYKSRDKITDKMNAHRIKKLEKKGYVILTPEPVEDVEPEDDSDDENE